MVALATAFVRLAAQPDRVSFIREGQKMGDLAGDSAGRNMGSRMVAGASAEFKRGEGRLVKDGDGIGDNVGRAMSRAVGRGSQKASGDTSAFGSALALTAARATLFGSTVAASLPSVIHLTAALAPAAGAALALPAAFLAAKVAAGTVKVAIAGVSDAIKSGLTGTAAQAKKALDALPPSARAFATSIIALKPQIDALRASVAQRFFLPLQDDIKPLTNLYFPLLRTQMADLAGPLGGLGEQIAESARKAGTFAAVRSIFSNTTQSVVNLRGAVDPLIGAFSALIQSTAPFLPGLATGFANLATRVAAFVTQAAQSGRISAAFQAAMTTLRDLGGIAVNVGLILGSVFRAAAVGSGSLLGNLRALTGQVAAFLRSAQGSAALTTVFSTLSTLGNALRTSLAAVLPAVARSLAIIGPVLAGLAGPAAQLVVALAPLLPYFTSLAAIVLRTLTPALAALAGWLARNQSVVTVLGTAIAGVVIGMRAYAAGVALAGLATKGWAAATGTVTVAMRVWNSTFATRIGVWAIDAAAAVRSTAATVANTVATRASAAAALIWTSVQRGAAIASAGLSVAMRAVGVAVRFAMGPVGLIITALGLLVTGLLYAYQHSETFRAFVDKLGRSIVVAWGQMRAVIGAVSSWFTGTIIPSIKTAINQAVTSFRFVQAVSRAVWSAIQLYVQTWWNVVRAIFVTVRSWLTIVGTAFRTFATIGGIAVRTLGAGIAAVWNSIRTGSFAPLRTFIGTTLPGAFRAGVTAITNAWNRIKEAARTPVAFVVNHVINPFIGGFNAISRVFKGPQIGKIGGFRKGGLFTPADVPGYDKGGRIAGMPSNVDNRLAPATIPGVGAVKLAGGEFIVNARDTAKALPILSWINAGMKRGGPREAAKRIGRPPIDPMGDGSEGWAFAGGGLIGWVKKAWGNIKDFATGAWDVVSNPAKLIKAPFEAALNGIPGGGAIKTFLVGAAKKILSGALNWLTGAGGGATGSAGAAQAFVRAQAGKPYVWASAGPRGYDCSGIVSAVYRVLQGKSPYSHIFSTGNLPGRWFRPGVGGSPLLAGWSHPGQSPASSATGHMAGQIAGLPFESRGSRGVVVGSAARRIGAFANLGHAVFAKGGLLGDGIRLFDSGGAWPSGTLGANLSGKTEYVSTDRGGGTVVEFHAHFHGPVASERAAEDMVYGAWKRLRRDKKIP